VLAGSLSELGTKQTGRILGGGSDQLRDYWLAKFFATNETVPKELSRDVAREAD